MDQIIQSSFYGEEEFPSKPRSRSYLLAWTTAFVIGITSAALTGFGLGRSGWPLLGWVPAELAIALSGTPEAPPKGKVIYYRDPDGNPSYSPEPTTVNGRGYVPVLSSEDVSFDQQADAAANRQANGRKILYYRNPMGLPDVSPTPKKDSMGMDYLPVYEGEEDGSTIQVSIGKLQRTGVRTESVAPRVLSTLVRSPGTIQLDERRVAVVSLRSESFIEKVEPLTTGDRVKEGQPLLHLYSPEISAAAAQYVSALTQSSGLVSVAGARRRLENLDVPEEVVREIERTRKVPRTITWSAPRDGIILERSAIDGMRAMSGDVLFRLADVSIVWALIDIAERDLGMIAVGQQVAIRPRGDANRTFSGTIGIIYPQVNMDTRTARVRVELANPEATLLPQMYVEAEIATGPATPVIAVPTSAVIDSGTRQIVIIDKGEGRFEPREITTGRRNDGFVEVREGIVAGETLVTSANFLIDAESNLKAALRGLEISEPTP
jgi:Cu(I)/Ag(I) efflux system membrane fusion protein